MALLSVKDIGKKENGNFSVRSVSFSQKAAQKIAIAGETGSGKTTLLKMIAGLLQPDEGQIFFEDKRVAGPFEKLIPGHPHIGYHSQHFELRNNYRVEEELEAKNLLTDETAHHLYEICRIQHLLKRRTDQLSGGERQRVVLARLLTTSPKLLLLDEPFSNLDAAHKRIIQSVITDIGNQLGVTCILVSHDAADTLSWADEIIVLKDGCIVQQGAPVNIYQQPVDLYCAGLFGEYNLVDTSNEALKALRPFSSKPGGQLLIRPEQFSISNAGNDGIAGTIQQILYWGSHYTLEVMAGGQRMKIRTDSNQFAIGDSVSLHIPASVDWYL